MFAFPQRAGETKKTKGAPPRLSQAAFRRSFTRHGDSGSAINGAKKAHRQRKTKYMREITPPRSSTLSLRDTREQKKKKWGEAQTSFIIERRNPRFPIAPLSLSACRLSFSPSAQQPVPQHTGPTPQIDSLSEHWFAAFAPRLGSVQ